MDEEKNVSLDDWAPAAGATQHLGARPRLSALADVFTATAAATVLTAMAGTAALLGLGAETVPAHEEVNAYTDRRERERLAMQAQVAREREDKHRALVARKAAKRGQRLAAGT